MEPLQLWCEPLQRACRLEADTGFCDLRGRSDTFSGFVVRCLSSPPDLLATKEAVRIRPLLDEFRGYAGHPVTRRRRLVARLRQLLHQWLCEHRPPMPLGTPRLRLAQPALAQRAASSPRLDPGTPLGEVAGIGPKTASRLARLGLLLVGDLVRHYPRDYLDYSRMRRIADLEAGHTATIVARVRGCHAFASPRHRHLAILELRLEDGSGRLRVTRFSVGRRFTHPSWLRSQQRQFPGGATVAVSGMVKEGQQGPSFVDPLIEVLESPAAPVRSERIGRLVPIYGLTEGLTADRLRLCFDAVLPGIGHWRDPLDPHLLRDLDLPSLAEARSQIHRPASREQLDRARRRLVFDEFLLLQLSLAQRRQSRSRRSAPTLRASPGAEGLIGRFQALLPFAFTEAQQRVLAEIRADMARPQPMARLLQGDVGSGKTIVAIAALLGAVEAGCQGVLMVPTEVLAEQHFRTLMRWMPHLHVSVDLLTGSTPTRRRRQLLDDLANGQLRLLVGTHALLEDPVRFDRLGLVVVDEQHRFGVRQRNRLLAKGIVPHLLTMTATPIPRTLALSLHGDLDVSQIDAPPPGRTPIRTRLLGPGGHREAHRLIREQVALGQRAYLVLPLVEESETLDLRCAVQEHAHLRDQVFPDLEVGLLHGRLSGEEKQRAISDFAAGRIQVLVCTTVVEVGVDVPEASVMVIDHAERFGLAQLHQLRGRVGRGAAASHCLLIDGSGDGSARARLEVLARCADGFEIAEMDLRLRGPGQVLGTRQSGLPDLALASLSEDGDLLELSRTVALSLLRDDPGLVRQPALRQALADQRRHEAARLN